MPIEQNTPALVKQEQAEDEAASVARTDSNESLSSLSDGPHDPHDLIERFVMPQRKHFPRALREINAGSKESCWFWFVLPTLPYVVNGVVKGSPNNRKYALKDEEQVIAYLKLPTTHGVNLRQNYIDMLIAIEKQLRKGVSLPRLLGPVDAPKAVSSFQLFERIGVGMEDEKLVIACKRVLKQAQRKPSLVKRLLRRGTQPEPKRPMLSY